MEQWTGIEPASTGFEDQQLFHLAHHCMVRAEGIEPSTFRLWADYSNHWVIPASSHNESGSGKDLHLTDWDWFWPLQAGTQLFAYIVPIYCTTFQFFTGLSCNSDSVYLFRHTTTLTMRGFLKIKLFIKEIFFKIPIFNFSVLIDMHNDIIAISRFCRTKKAWNIFIIMSFNHRIIIVI